MASDVRIHFGGVAALSGVTVRVDAGEIAGLIGPNGSGKTTLFNVITGICQPSAGQILIEGIDVTGFPPHLVHAGGISRTFQTLRLFPKMTILENIMVAVESEHKASLWGALFRTRRTKEQSQHAIERANECLAFFGPRLVDWRYELPGALSYANRRRLEIARAMASGPKLLLLDEPSAGMNPQETMELAGQIQQIRDRGITILIIEHDMGLVMELCGRIIVLDHGQVIAEGGPADIQAHPTVLEAYLGATSTSALLERGR